MKHGVYTAYMLLVIMFRTTDLWHVLRGKYIYQFYEWSQNPHIMSNQVN
jgi:hypothetical protein